jgi:hypothetical protein
MLRAATLPGAGTVVGGLSRLPVALTRPIVRALPVLAARSDARPLAEGLRGLSGLQRRTAFVRTAHTVLDWRGQTVSASRQTNLLSDIPVLLAWGADDKTMPPRHQQAFADAVPHAVTVEIAAAGHYLHETASTQLLPALIEFLSTTTAFRYSETRWRHLLTHQDIGRIDHAAGARRRAHAQTRSTAEQDAVSGVRTGVHGTPIRMRVGVCHQLHRPAWPHSPSNPSAVGRWRVRTCGGVVGPLRNQATLDADRPADSGAVG